MTDRTFIALDAGGTMTDAVVVTGGGQVALGKALTDYEDEARSFGVAVSDGRPHAPSPSG
jgi:N-methylhydantoinase A/oxoprolinase/acetone carboxylase beta subunit